MSLIRPNLELDVSRHGKAKSKQARKKEPFVKPWKKPKPIDFSQTAEAETTLRDTSEQKACEFEAPAEKSAKLVCGAPKLASIRWAHNIVHRFRGESSSLLRILEVYVMYNSERISEEAVNFFLKEIERLREEKERFRQMPPRPFLQSRKEALISKSA